MSRKIGDVLARTFREVCEESNAKVKTDFSKISAEEIDLIEKILAKVDNERFNLQQELKKSLKFELES
ncbi:MAG TPA: hypothetical protein VMX17_03510 [Candidatus Glassbacteria bacterium]|nr:hypothetical protein [Candidatus Glassbacteria bacterium]